MIDAKLDLSSLDKAVARLEEGLTRYDRNRDDDQIRDGLIQRFEFTYELCHKMLKRYLEMASPSTEAIETLSFPDLIRTCNEQGLLLSDWPAWKIFRDNRNKSSHTYDEEIALEVTQIIPDFLREARFLRDKLVERGAEKSKNA